MLRRFLFLVFSQLLLIPSFALAQTKSSSAPRQPSWATNPADTPAGVIEIEPAIREARSEAFNDPYGVRPRLDENKPGPVIGTGSVADRGPRDPMPVGDSDDVIVGTVTGYQSFLSSDHTAIYTELYVSTEKVLKASSSEIAPGIVLTILWSGGALRYKGKLLKFPPTASGVEDLDVKERYVLFLELNSKLKAYRDLEAWRLENDHAIPMDLTQRASSQREPKLIRYSQLTEQEFLREIETEIQRNAVKN